MSIVFSAEEVYEIGIQIEKNGRLFYQTVASRMDDPDIARLFLYLSDWESRHVELFEHLKENLSQESKGVDFFDPENIVHLYLKTVADQFIFIGEEAILKAAENIKTAQEALKYALNFEKDSVVYYASMKEIVRDDLGKKEIDRLIQEEVYHVGQLTEELTRTKKA